MKKSGWRLAVSALLFIAWIGYLAYLAATTTQPNVLSRPQFLAADMYVVVHLGNKEQPLIAVKQVTWSAISDDSKRLVLTVKDLVTVDEEHGWQGPGEYILALSKSKDNAELFELTPLPRTPGFPGGAGRIYMATPATLRQLELLTKEYHPPS